MQYTTSVLTSPTINNTFINHQYFVDIFSSSLFTADVFYREVFEEEIAPVVLDIEEEAKDEHHVHEADEDDDHHPRVDRHPDLPLRLCHYISEECSECIYEHLVIIRPNEAFRRIPPQY